MPGSDLWKKRRAPGGSQPHSSIIPVYKNEAEYEMDITAQS